MAGFAMDRRRLLMLAPFAVAVAGGAGFWSMLQGMKAGTFDPRGVPSPIVGRSVPSFTCRPKRRAKASPAPIWRPASR